jgi:hypothetical protein
MRLTYRPTTDGFVGVSRTVRHRRRFEFLPGGFVCRDEIVFRRRCRLASFTPASFLFRSLRDLGGGEFETRHGRAGARVRLLPGGEVIPNAAVSASGPLVVLRHSRGPTDALAGDTVTVELRVDFL